MTETVNEALPEPCYHLQKQMFGSASFGGMVYMLSYKERPKNPYRQTPCSNKSNAICGISPITMCFLGSGQAPDTCALRIQGMTVIAPNDQLIRTHSRCIFSEAPNRLSVPHLIENSRLWCAWLHLMLIVIIWIVCWIVSHNIPYG